MIDVLCVCSGYLDVPSLLSLLCVSSACRRIIGDYTIWHEILCKAGFKRLAKTHCSSSTLILTTLPTMQQHVHAARGCELCWKKRAPPIRLTRSAAALVSPSSAKRACLRLSLSPCLWMFTSSFQMLWMLFANVRQDTYRFRFWFVCIRKKRFVQLYTVMTPLPFMTNFVHAFCCVVLRTNFWIA